MSSEKRDGVRKQSLFLTTGKTDSSLSPKGILLKSRCRVGIFLANRRLPEPLHLGALSLSIITVTKIGFPTYLGH